MNRWKLLTCACLLLALLAVIPAKTVKTLAFSPVKCGQWHVASSPNLKATNDLNSVTAVSANDVWAAGFTENNKSIYQPLIEHWNGSNWKVVASPTFEHGAQLDGIAAVSANDIWAVGYSTKQLLTLIEHWNGSTWTIVKSPNPNTSGNQLDAIAAVSAKNVWAVGSYFDNKIASYQTLIEHWDGSQWSVIPSANASNNSNFLFSVSAAAANDIWSVGEFYGTMAVPTLIEHWNGKRWSVVSSPNPGPYNMLNGVAAISATDAWVVGNYESQTLTEHWNGTQWSIVSGPTPPSRDTYLYGVSATSANNVWAVGSYVPENGLIQTLTEHWNGALWSIVPSPNLNPNGSVFEAATSIPGSKIVWAVGTTFPPSGGTNTLTAYHC